MRLYFEPKTVLLTAKNTEMLRKKLCSQNSQPKIKGSYICLVGKKKKKKTTEFKLMKYYFDRTSILSHYEI